jgi:hypothetical protein
MNIHGGMWRVGAVAGAALLLGAPARADERLPLPLARRPLTLTRSTLRVDGAFNINRVSVTVTSPLLGSVTASSTAVSLNAGAGFGITDDLEAGATVLPLQLSPDFAFGNPTAYGRFRFLRGSFELGGELSVVLPVQGSFGLTVGLPMLIHVGEVGRIDTGVALGLVFSDPLGKNLLVPIGYAHNVTPNVFLGARTGLGVPNFKFDALTIPLGVFGGYTLASGAGNSPALDAFLGFDFPGFLTPGGASAVNTNVFTIGLGLRYFLAL